MVGFVLVTLYKAFKKLPSFMNWYFHDPSPMLFEFLAKWGLKNKYRFISLEECQAILSGEKRLDDRVIFLSFDDAWKSNVDLLPICEKYNVPITIFVSTQPIEDGNFWWEYAIFKGVDVAGMKRLPYGVFCEKLEQLKTGVSLQRSAIDRRDFAVLANHPLVCLQSHTVTHPILTNCPEDVLSDELTKSREILKEMTGKPIFAFCYPNGNVSPREVKSVEDAGYTIAFTIEQRPVNIPESNLFLIPRMSINSYGGKYENLARALGVFQYITRKRYLIDY